MSLEIAYSLMREYHASQVDKSGEPYYLHPERVGATVQHLGKEYAAAGYLHDIVEDTPMSLAALREFGVSEEVVEAVDALTRREGELYYDYVLRAKANKIARAVKVADLIDNMRPGAPDSLYERYRRSMLILCS